MFTVLVADGDNRHCSSISSIIKSEFPDRCVLLQANDRRDLYDSIYNVKIDIALLDADFPGISSTAIIHQLHQTNPLCVILLFADMQSLGHKQHDQDLPIMDYLVKPFTNLELILTLEEAFHQCQQIRSSVCKTVENSKIQLIKAQIESYIRANFAQILSMQDVARAMNYSDTHFCRLFKQCFKINFSVYLNEFRVEQAKQMLANTNLTVKEVSISCGYRDTSYFIRVFKRFTGTTPSDYRISKLTMTAK